MPGESKDSRGLSCIPFPTLCHCGLISYTKTLQRGSSLEL